MLAIPESAVGLGMFFLGTETSQQSPQSFNGGTIGGYVLTGGRE
jgi:hypothetical protein